MKIFIDTAIIDEIKEAATWGIVDGVTTNPSLIAKNGGKLEDVIREIVSLIDGPISAEVTEADYKTMYKQALELAKIHKNIVIKLPMTLEGIKTCKALTEKGIKTNVTLVFSVNQALLACKAGATYISPFLGRMDDKYGEGSGEALLQDIRAMIDNYCYETEIIAASIRHTTHAEAAALIGSDIATIPFKVLKEMYQHELTDAGLKIFDAAIKK